MKAYKTLFISDVHMSNQLPRAVPTKNGVTDRLEDQVALWDRVYAAAVEHEVESIQVLGDLFDKSRVDAVTLTATAACLAASPVPIYILPGNHDASTVRGERFTVEAFGAIERKGLSCVTSDDAPLQVSDWLRFWPLEYTTKERAVDKIAEFRRRMSEDRRKVEVLLIHQSVIGCKHFGWVCDSGVKAEEVCEGFDWVFSGHFHEDQEFGPNGMYLGAPMHHRLDDVGRRAGFWIVKFKSNRKIEKTFVDGGAPKFYLEHWGRHDAGRLVKYNSGDYVQIYVHATHADYEAERPKVLEHVKSLCARGIRASEKLKPIYHHAARVGIKSYAGTERLALEAAASSYVDLPDVDTSGLDKEVLKRIAAEAIAAARSGYKSRSS